MFCVRTGRQDLCPLPRVGVGSLLCCRQRAYLPESGVMVLRWKVGDEKGPPFESFRSGRRRLFLRVSSEGESLFVQPVSPLSVSVLFLLVGVAASRGTARLV